MMAQSNFDKHNLINRLSVEDTEELIRDIILVDPDYQNIINTDEDDMRTMDNFLELPICVAGISSLNILSNGDVIACSGWNGLPVGNLYESSLSEIWNNSPILKKIRSVKQKDFEKCFNCEAFNYCSRCLVRNYNESDGDMYALPEHFCEVAFMNKRVVEQFRKSL